MTIPANFIDGKGAAIDVLVLGGSINERRLLESLSQYSRHRWRLRFIESTKETNRFLAGQGKYATEREPDIVVVDRDSFEDGGWEAMRKLRVSYRLGRVPVVAMGARTSTEDSQRAKDFGVPLLHKPQSVIEIGTFLDRIAWLWRVSQEDDQAAG